MVTGAILQPVIGLMLDHRWAGMTKGGQRVYDTSDYQFALLLLPAFVLGALLVSFLVKETHAVPPEEPPTPDEAGAYVLVVLPGSAAERHGVRSHQRFPAGQGLEEIEAAILGDDAPAGGAPAVALPAPDAPRGEPGHG